MAIAKREMLVALINSLDRAEKRYFTAHYDRSGKNKKDKFYQLFLHLSGGGDPTDVTFRRRIGVDDAGKMANLQRHLYGQLMESLRRQHRSHDQVIQVQENLDYAHLLYRRGLPLQALAILKKAKSTVRADHLDLHHILILEMEKMIQAAHITRSGGDRMRGLITESQRRQEIQTVTTRLSNLQLGMHRYFIDNGHIRNAEEAARFYHTYTPQLADIQLEQVTFRERIALQRAQFWYHYCRLELREAARRTGNWVALIREDANTCLTNLPLYLKGMDRCLMLAFLRDRPEEHRDLARSLQSTLADLPVSRMPRDSALQFQFLHPRTRLNELLLNKESADLHSFAKSINTVDGVDRHKCQMLHYKLAVLLVRAGDRAGSLDHLNPILDDRKPLRHDLVIYARLLFIYCHLRLGNGELAGYAINNLTRYLTRVSYPSTYPRVLITLLRNMRSGKLGRRALKDFDQRVANLRATGYETRELRYLPADILLGNNKRTD